MGISFEQEEAIRNLQNRIELMKSGYTSLWQKNRALSGEREKLAREIDELKEKISILEQQYNTVKLAKSLTASTGEAENAKLQIKRIVREIDTCIALLNK